MAERTEAEETLRQDLAYAIGQTNRATGHVYIDGNDACLAVADRLIDAGWTPSPRPSRAGRREG